MSQMLSSNKHIFFFLLFSMQKLSAAVPAKDAHLLARLINICSAYINSSQRNFPYFGVYIQVLIYSPLLLIVVFLFVFLSKRKMGFTDCQMDDFSFRLAWGSWKEVHSWWGVSREARVAVRDFWWSLWLYFSVFRLLCSLVSSYIDDPKYRSQAFCNAWLVRCFLCLKFETNLWCSNGVASVWLHGWSWR